MSEDYKLAKWLNNELSEEEKIVFEQSSDFAMYKKIKEASARLQTPNFDEDKILNSVLNSKKEPKVINLKTRWLARIAAVLVIGFGLLFAYESSKVTYYGTNDLVPIVKLPDNSEVAINADSEIEYQKWFWNNNRKIDLKGEAYFRVAKGKTFEVNTDLGKVTVLGTQFNVNSKKDLFEVTCYEGKVKVNFKNEEVILTKGMLISFNKEVKKESNTTSTRPLWTVKEAEINFTNQSFESIIAKVEKTYNVEINAKDVKTSQLFTGKLPSDNLDVTLQIIASTYHLQIIKSNETSFELVRK